MAVSAECNPAQIVARKGKHVRENCDSTGAACSVTVGAEHENTVSPSLNPSRK